MKRRTKKEGLGLVRKFRESGLGQEKFAKRARINVATLRYWLRRERRAGDSTKPVRFIELAPALERDDEGRIHIETPSGVVVRLDQLPSAEYLVELVLGLGRA